MQSRKGLQDAAKHGLAYSLFQGKGFKSHPKIQSIPPRE